MTENDNLGESDFRLAKVRVLGLFGLFDHSITLNQGITIVHGPNGVGKTRLLQMLAALPNLRLDVLRRTPFDSLSLIFTDGTQLLITTESPHHQLQLVDDGQTMPSTEKQRLNLVLSVPGSPDAQGSFPPPEGVRPRRTREVTRYIDLELPFLERVGIESWIDRESGESLSIGEVLEAYGPHLSVSLRDFEPAMPDPLRDFLNGLRITFIDTERLTTRITERDPVRYRPSRTAGREMTVDSQARDLSWRIERHLADYAGLSAKLDRTFPQRALAGSGEVKDPDEIREDFVSLAALRERLTEAGILGKTDELPWPSRELNETEREFLDLYVRDTREKLALFDPLLGKIELLAEMLDKRFLFKSMKIDREKGYYFVAPGGEALSPKELSSGEQHELVFAYKLLFGVPSNSLVLIDEPEISLNVAWQQKFLEDLLQIRQLNQLEFLIATHSPQIIHDRMELATSLGGRE